MESIIQNLEYFKNYWKRSLISKYKPRKKKLDRPYEDIGILNPSIGTSNLGDIIIFDSVYSILRDIFPSGLFTNFPTQLHTDYDSKSMMGEKDYLFVSGTNLLSSNLNERYQWKINNSHKRYLKNNVVLLGCGWWQYQGEINKYSKSIYKSLLSTTGYHSVRDQYTVEKFKSIGINNVLNTTCPTLWSLDENHCKSIPVTKADNVVTTLTFYHKNEQDDYKMLKLLSDNYKVVYLWIQGMDDYYYYNSLNKGFKNIVFLPPTIEAYNNILKDPSIEYVGTRLHAGVRALQNGIRTQILAVDNRAIEIGKDTNLNVIPRENVESLTKFIFGQYSTNIILPQENIDLWKSSLA